MGENAHLIKLVEAWGGDTSFIPEQEIEPFPDETRSPKLNDFIRLARHYMTGRKSPGEFVWGMQKMMPLLRQCLLRHRDMVPNLKLSGYQAVLAEEADHALQSLLEGLAEMVASFTQEDLPRVEAGIELCKRSAVTLETWYAELAVLERREYGTVCNHCGHFCKPLEIECYSCKSQLAHPSSPYTPENDWVVTPNPYSTIFLGLLERITEKKSPTPQWRFVIDHLCEGFSQLKRTLTRLSVQGNLLDLRLDLTEQVVELLQAIEVSLEAFRVLQLFPGKGDLRAVDEAWFRLVDVVPRLNRGGFECRHALVELLEYMSSDGYLQRYEGVRES